MSFSEKTYEMIKKAGWDESRVVNISKYREALEEEGYKLNARIEGFLKQFAGLTIKHPNRAYPEEEDYFNIDPKDGAGFIDREVVEDYGKRAGEELVPVGRAYRGNMVMMMSESGKFYLGLDELLVFAGINFYKAFNNLCENKDDNMVKVE